MYFLALLARYLGHLLTEFDQTFTTNELWEKIDAWNFGVKKINSQGHVGVKYVPKCTFGLVVVTCWRRHNSQQSCNHHLQAAFNKFQDYILNTMTVNRTFLTVMLLFNILSLQFTAVFPLFYKLADTRSIKFLLAPCRNFQTQCCGTSSSFLNWMSPSDSLCGPNKRKLLAAKSGLYGKPSPSLQFSYLSNGHIAWWAVPFFKNDTFVQQTWSIAANCWSWSIRQ